MLVLRLMSEQNPAGGSMLSFSVNELRERKTAALGIQVYLLLLFVIERMARVLVLAVKTN